MLVTTVVLINLLIAMMSDTYQRIQARNHIIDFVLRLKMFLHSIVLRSLTKPALCNFLSSNNLMWSGSSAWPSSLGGQLRLKSESSISRR